MRRNELELIAALAEGSLEDETEARALIESSPDHRAEYEAQKAAIVAMRSVPIAEMTDHEKAALHRDLWTALQSRAPASVKVPWYYRWSFVGVGVLVVAVGIGTVLSQQDGDDAGTASPVARELDTEESAADGGIPDTTSAAATAEAPAAGEDAFAGAGTDQQSLFFLENASRARAGEYADTQTTESANAETFAAEHASCVEAAGLEDYVAIGEVTVEKAREAGLDPAHPYLIVIPAGIDLASDTPVAFVELETCALVFIDS